MASINVEGPESQWHNRQHHDQPQQDYQQQHRAAEKAHDMMSLETGLKIAGYSVAYLVSVFIAFQIIVAICLFFRLLRVTLGRRIKPDGKKAILITGATSGIGLVISKYFFHLGFTVIGAYYNDQEPGYAELLELSIKASSSSSSSLLPTDQHHQVTLGTSQKAAATMGSQNRSPDDQQQQSKTGHHRNKARLFLVRMDVRSRESIEKSSQEVDSILDQYGIELYSLINNAGIARDVLFHWASRESIRDVIETNLTGVMMVSRQFMYRIIKSKGRIVNITSGLYMFPSQGISQYGSSKCAVAYFSDALDADISEYGASSRCVVPGNFIAVSNIMFPRLRTLQECIAQLTPEEKELYRESIESFTKIMDNLVRKRFSLSDNLDPVQVSSIYKVRLPDDVMSGQVSSSNKRKRDTGSVSLFERLVGGILQRLDGGANVESLETSGLIQGYDYAVRLENCPRRLYAGNRFYSHYTGPLIDYSPRVVLDFIAKYVMVGLKNQ